MKKIFSILFCLGFLIHSVSSQNVSKERASSVGLTFFNTSTKYTQKKEPSLDTKEWKSQDSTCFYIVQMAEGGWVIVSADERIKPILAYSPTGFYDSKTCPLSIKWILKDYADQILYIKKTVPIDSIASTVKRAWNQLEHSSLSKTKSTKSDNGGNGNGSTIYTPGNSLLNQPNRGYVKWGQSHCTNCYSNDCINTFNQYCPSWYSNSCGRTFAGCGAIAIAQVLWYWQWPSEASIPIDIDMAGTPSISNETKYYDWEKMLAEINYDTRNDTALAVAKLIRDCGYACHTLYGDSCSSSSRTFVNNALSSRFSYHTNGYALRSGAWGDAIRNEINNGRPVIYNGLGKEGHWFIVDGYEASDITLFHINWGWRGSFDGYYSLDNLNPAGIYFNNCHAAIMGIYPNCGQLPTDLNLYLPGVLASNPTTFNATNSISFQTIIPDDVKAYLNAPTVILSKGFYARKGGELEIKQHPYPYCNSQGPGTVNP